MARLKASKKPKSFQIVGMKDPRGPDNTLTIWIDESGDLRIHLQKPTVRCYAYSHIEEDECGITIVQKK